MLDENAIEIEVLQGEDAGKQFSFRTQTVRIGRGRACQLTLNDPKVGRTHLEVSRQRKGLFVCTDLDSSNGTFIAGKKIGSTAVHAGTTITLGDTVLRIGSQPRGTQRPRRQVPSAVTRMKVLIASGFLLITIAFAMLLSHSPREPLTLDTIEQPAAAIQRLRQGDFAAAEAALWRLDSDSGEESHAWFRPGYLRMIEQSVERATRHERGGRQQFAYEEWLVLARRLETDPDSPVSCPLFGEEWQAAVRWIRSEKLDALYE